MPSLRSTWVAVLLLAACLAPARAQVAVGASGAAAPATERPEPVLPKDFPVLKAGVFEWPPYAMRDTNGEWHGLAVTLLRQVANRANLRFDLVPFDGLPAAVAAVEHGDVDLLAVGLDPTPQRELQMNFSHAFHQSGTSAAVRQLHTMGLGTIWRQVVDSSMPLILSIVMGFMLLMGVLVALVERRRTGNTGFNGPLLHSVGNGIWWSITTMSTVGYGDRVPTSWFGRLVGGVWMLLAFILMTVLAGVIASDLTVRRMQPELRQLSELRQVRVGAVPDSAAAMDARAMGVVTHDVRNLLDGLQALHAGRVDAVVGDTSALRYLTREHAALDLALLPQQLVIEYPCLPLSPQLAPQVRDAVNYWLLRVTESNDWQIFTRATTGEPG